MTYVTGFFLVFAGMLIGYRKKMITIIVTILFAGFLLYSLVGTLSGYNMECGCFGGLVESRFGWSMVIRNAALFMMVVMIYKENNFTRYSKINSI